MFGDRLRQLDLRASKLFRVGGQRFQLNVDLYNAMNGSTATFIRNTYSAPDAVTAFHGCSRRRCRTGASGNSVSSTDF